MEKMIKLSGRIDSTNASMIEKDIIQRIKDSDEDIVIDFSDLEYISSAGLRIILKLKKMNKSMRIVNCNSEIFNIMEMTGFTDIIQVSKVYRKISIDNCPILGKGANGIVYRYDPETIVKVYNKKNSLDMIKTERELAKKAFVKGIPTAIPYDIVKVDNSYGAVFEMLNAKSYAQLINDGQNIDGLVKESVDLMKKFHSIELDVGELPSKRINQIEKAKFCANYLPKDIGEKLVKLIEDVPDSKYMIHGDFQVKNIMKQNGETLLIDMDTLSEGHPIFEFGAIYSTYIGYSCLSNNNPSNFLGISSEQCEKIKDLTFKYYFNNKNEDEVKEIESKAKIISYLQIYYSLINRLNNGLDNNEIKNAIDFCKNYLVNNINSFNNLYFEIV